VHLFSELKKKHYCDRKSQIQFVSTSYELIVRRYIGVMPRAQHHVARRAINTREMLLLSAGKLFQEVGYVRASIHRIAAGVNAPKGTFYNYFESKEELASILVDRQFAAIYQIPFSSAGRECIRSTEAAFPLLSHGTADDRNSSTPIACDLRCRGSGNPAQHRAKNRR
jgi:AcrR family transcriptional regulator